MTAMSQNPRALMIEIGTEELPPKALDRLSCALSEGFAKGLAEHHLKHGEITRFATPRRIAFIIEDLVPRQADRTTERLGPAYSAAFDADGAPRPAALGFARSCGVDIAELACKETPKGKRLAFTQSIPGKETAILIPEILFDALKTLPIPKRMRWGSLDVEFVRPVHTLTILYGDTSIDAEMLGVHSAREIRGHRFHHPAPITLNSPEDYAQSLMDPGHVIANFAERRARIERDIKARSREIGGEIVADPDLLDELTALTEWPVILAGSFDERFLELPPEVLTASLKDHQKCFPVQDNSGQLINRFIAVSNIVSKEPDKVRTGFERVIKPRLCDAEFFWQQDRKIPLDKLRDTLKGMVFQQDLGSLAERTERVSTLAGEIAMELGLSKQEVTDARRAGEISRCDLMTHMVAEFPSLQGIMGSYYARHDGEHEAVATSIEEMYLPRHAGDHLPETPVGRILALADRLDLLAGIYGIGQIPSGEKDPYGLRRASLGVLRILMECDLDLDLTLLLSRAVGHYGTRINATQVIPQLTSFVLDRLRAYYSERGFSVETLAAVRATGSTTPLDLDRRIKAVTAFAKLPDAGALAAANKRIGNILKQAGDIPPGEIFDTLLEDPAEQRLNSAIDALEQEVTPLIEAHDYQAALQRLATLREHVDDFFDQVMVMCDNTDTKHNRLRLLARLRQLFIGIADISKLKILTGAS